MSPGTHHAAGFTLLPLMLAMSLIAAIAFLLNRDNAMNAEMVTSQSSSDRARYAAEAGLQAINSNVQNMNCSGYNNLGTTTFGAQSFTATVNPSSGTPVTLTATGRAADGSSAALTRAGVVVHQTLPRTLLLQPPPGTGSRDTYIEIASGTNSWGIDTVLWLSYQGDLALLWFDLSAIPAGALITSASLSLYQSSAQSVPAGNTLSVYRVTKNWIEGATNGGTDGATWNNAGFGSPWTTPGGDYDPVATAVIPADTNNGWKTWDVSTLVSDWKNGTLANQGMLVAPSAGINNMTFVSHDDASQPTRWPELSVSFLPPCSWMPPSTMLTLNASADAYLDNTKTSLNYGGTSVMKASGGGTLYRPILAFDTSGIPAGTLISSAVLNLYVSATVSANAVTKTLTAFQVTEAWVEGTKNGSGSADGVTWARKNESTNWATAGGSYATPAAGAVTIADTGFRAGWIAIDITGLAQAWIDGVAPNYGVIVTLSSSETFSINSAENSANQPSLVITY